MTVENDRIRLDEYSLGAEKLWGLPAIAKFLGLSIDAVRDLAKQPDVPIFRPGKRYFAVRSELWRWLRTKPSNE